MITKSRQPAPDTTDRLPAITARQLDRLADYELHLGHHLAAEHLAALAAELREVRS